MLQLNVLGITNDARQMHGLRQDDYERYRKFCAGKIARLRAKCDRKQIGQGKKYVKRENTLEDFASIGELEILVFEVERAWAYAMHLRSQIVREPTKKHHMLRKFKRAVSFADSLVALCKGLQTSGRLDIVSLFGAKAFAASIQGQYLVEQKQWRAAMESFHQGRMIYSHLAAAVDNSEYQALCHHAIDQIEPNIRFCAYNLRMGTNNSTVDDLVTLIENKESKELRDKLKTQAPIKTTTDSSKDAPTITFRSQRIVCRNEKLYALLNQIQEEETQLSTVTKVEEKLTKYQRVLKLYRQAEKLAQTDVKADQLAASKIKSTKSVETSRQYQLILSSIALRRVDQMIQRVLDSLELKNVPHKEYIQHLKTVDRIVKSLDDTLELDIVKMDPALLAIQTAKQTFLSSVRSFYLSTAYLHAKNYEACRTIADTSKSQLLEATVAFETLTRKSGQLSDEDKRVVEIGVGRCRTMERYLDSLVIQVQATVVMDKNVDEETADAEKLDGAESFLADVIKEDKNILSYKLETFPTLSAKDAKIQLVPSTPRLLPIPAKPLFFDIAYRGLQFPKDNLERRAKGLERVPTGRQESAKPAAGVGGWFGGWLGGKK